jgi:hypothetical protein
MGLEASPSERAKLMKDMDLNLEAILSKHMHTDDVKEKEMAEDIRKFFGSQFSSESMMGKIEGLQYQAMLFDIIMGLHELIYIKHFSYFLEGRDVLMVECRSLSVFMLSKIKDGRMYALHETDLKTRNPTINQNMIR